MKRNLLIFVVIFFIVSCVCGTKSDNSEKVLVKKTYDYDGNYAHELFVQNKNEISAYSFIFSKKLNEISLYIDVNTSVKRYNIYSNKKDTTCCSLLVSHHKYSLCDYNNFVRQLRLCLENINIYYNIESINKIYFSTANLQEVSIAFTDSLSKEKFCKNHKWYTEEQIVSALYKTSFIDDLNKVLEKFKLSCNLVKSDGLAMIYSNESQIKEKIFHSRGVVKLINIPMVIYISKIDK